MIQPVSTKEPMPTVWGLTPVELHDRFWASRGVQVVRCGEVIDVVEDAELFLLTAGALLTIFRMRGLIEDLSWVKPRVMWVRINDTHERGYRERVLRHDDGRLRGFERDYGGADTRLSRVALTPDRKIALAWQRCSNAREGWAMLRQSVHPNRRLSHQIRGWTYDRNQPTEVHTFVRDLIGVWKQPGATVERVTRAGREAWVDQGNAPPEGVTFIGPTWIGAGRALDANEAVVGPAVLWDDPASRPEPEHLDWREIEPGTMLERPVRVPRRSTASRAAKRLFDIVFALLALILVLPVFPIVMLAIWLEDGGPFFFAHMRETVGGREFPCFKFRSMRKDAEAIKAKLAEANQVDGPQFFMEQDPRVTNVGRWLRKLQIDELPQFFNVLRGEMSVVGPRPSPRKENQFCPPWREARLSVRPGVTGLWQVCRTREEGKDFQEWIRFDIEYVEHGTLMTDIWIVYRTIRMLVLSPFSQRG
ncbi:sugar transferase [Mucisphaera calidilacus]|uniref:UDP-N-acetylgalactosamine-undecaprenyl-phosphate N-acetylgalactosaminephosphotransferase n=1 Tax=Mucisphaera calidilacus TaxID=2527982 RepID=A0A518BVK6_9BACT|nr:sugar transferase [Mucisphaera calidilacus]QDU70974.1 UDP-N-acetylgalactosamine-undecaprenyl-phosphate N-acetylgalactosaminephosphotransferase [Mucisphaera calidilacus]